MSCDTVVIGAGHNGLVAAWRLAKAGRQVVVCEARSIAGGLAGGEEFHPGFRAPGVLHDTSFWRSWLSDEMGLAERGWRRRAAPPRIIATEAGELLTVPQRSGTEGAEGLGAEDLEALAAWRGFVDQVSPAICRLLDRPPPRLDAGNLSEVLGLARDGWALRRLGRATMTELLRVGPMPASDWLRERFESEALIEALIAPALLGSWLGPHSAGSAANLLAREATAGDETSGGAPALIAALVGACEAAGVEIATGTAVERIRVEDGAVVAVGCRGGCEISCSQILASCNPRTTLLDLLPPAVLPLAIRDQVENFRCRGSAAKIHVALDGPLTLGGRVVEAAELGGGSIDALERAFDAIKYRRISETPYLEVRQASVDDPSLAPDGGHVLSIVVGYAPYDLAGGWTDRAKAELEERVLARVERSAPGTRRRVRATQVLTPVDLEASHHLPGGQLHHGEQALDQLLFVRPGHRLAHYATPVRGLYLGGSGSHPGGGITGVPGWLGADAALNG